MGRILITGANGQVGRELTHLSWPVGFEAVALDRAVLDLDDANAIATVVAEGDWAAVVNCAAFTAVDRAESAPVAAWRTNALAPAALAEATRRRGIPIVQVSTDYVFDGTGETAREPDAPIGPINVYGAAKAAGEIAVRLANPRHAIVRTSWVVSPHGANFVKTMLRLGAERDHLRVVDDQWGAPTVARHLADALMRICVRLVDDADAPTGTWHFTQAGATTWCGVAREVFRLAGDAGRPVPTVDAIATADYPTPARRPANSRLSTRTLGRDFAITPEDWRTALAETVAALLADPMGDLRT